MAFGFGFGMPRSFAVPPFSPASLFANGEQGWWYDPSNYGPNGTLFQDSAGTTPVTAMEQPVGLQLDLSKGATLGPELLTNGSFTTDLSGWTPVSTLTNTVTWISSGAARLNIATTSGECSIAQGTFIAGQWYKLTFTATLISGGAIRVQGPLPSAFIFTTTGAYVQYFQANSTGALTFTKHASTAVWDITNVKISTISGNHRFQTTSANRPVVSARVNLLTKTEQFNDAVWNAAAGNVTVSGNKIIPSATSGQHYVSQGSATSGVTHTIVVKAKQAGYTWLKLVAFNQYANFDLANGAVGTNFSGVSRSISAVGDGSYVCTFTFTSTSSTGGQGCVIKVGTADNANWDSANFSGNGTDGIQLYHADLRPTNQGVNLPAYQRVNTSTDYDSTGFPIYIKPNGSNQFMQTNSINFSSTDKMTVWQGVRKLSDATAFAVVSEFSSNWNTNTGSFVVFAPNEFAGTYGVASRGTAGVGLSQVANASGYAAPITNVLASFNDISGDLTTLRINGVAQTSGTGDKGAGNFGNYPAYFYMRAGTSLPFSGHDYGSIARGAASTAAQITAGETYINSKTKAY